MFSDKVQRYEVSDRMVEFPEGGLGVVLLELKGEGEVLRLALVLVDCMAIK